MTTTPPSSVSARGRPGTVVAVISDRLLSPNAVKIPDMTNLAQTHDARLEALQAWTRIWNGQLDEAAQVLAPDFTIWFGGEQIGPGGDRVRCPQDLADLIADFRAQRPGLIYHAVDLAVHGDVGVALWGATRGDLHVGGIDVFTFDDHGAKIRHADSVTGQRPHHQ